MFHETRRQFPNSSPASQTPPTTAKFFFTFSVVNFREKSDSRTSFPQRRPRVKVVYRSREKENESLKVGLLENYWTGFHLLIFYLIFKSCLFEEVFSRVSSDFVASGPLLSFPSIEKENSSASDARPGEKAKLESGKLFLTFNFNHKRDLSLRLFNWKN